MERAKLRDIILEQHTLIWPAVTISRSVYVDVSKLLAAKQIIIIAGLRRCGKSTLMQQIRAKLPERDYFFNFDDERLIHFSVEDFQVLHELFIEIFGEQHTFYFDEIQNIPGWERFVRRLHDYGYKIYITGSNATMLRKELGTRLTGRYIQFNLYPYAFCEYLTMRNISIQYNTTLEKGRLNAAFNDFMQQGGLPEYVALKNHDYLHDLYESILYRDIIARYNIGHQTALKELTYFLASNIGKECTYNSLKNAVGIASATTLSDYCRYLEDTYLCYFINRFDFSLKKQLHYAKKVYFVDQALAQQIGFRCTDDMGRLLENIVFLELKRRKQDIYFHKQKKECDFITRHGRHVLQAIQVCVHLSDEKTKQREIEGLLEAMEAYQLDTGLIITLNDHGEEIINSASPKTIKIVSIVAWLLG